MDTRVHTHTHTHTHTHGHTHTHTDTHKPSHLVSTPIWLVSLLLGLQAKKVHAVVNLWLNSLWLQAFQALPQIINLVRATVVDLGATGHGCTPLSDSAVVPLSPRGPPPRSCMPTGRVGLVQPV